MSESTTSKIHLGLIGLGQISRHHIAGIFANSESLQLDAVYDCKDAQSRLDKLQKATGCALKDVKCCENAEEMLTMKNITHVVICTPPDSHAQYVKQVLDNGKIPLVEKPLVATHDKLPTEATINHQSPLGNNQCSFAAQVHTIYHWQFAPEVQAVKREIDRNKETIRSVKITICDPYLTFLGLHIKKEHQPKVDAWNDSGINALSYVAYLLGEDMMSKATDVHLRHWHYVDGLPVHSVAEMKAGDVKVTIRVIWGRRERKKSVIRTNKHIYVVNHKKQKVRFCMELKQLPVNLTKQESGADRLDCHYIRFYRDFDWKQSPGNMSLTQSLHSIFAHQGYTHRYAASDRLFSWLRKKGKDIPEYIVLISSLLVLILFLWYIYGMPCIRLHNPFGVGKHNFEMMDFLVNTLASLVTIVVSYVFYRGVQWVKRHNEDAIKVEFSDRELRRQYGSNYLKRGSINNSQFSVYYDPFFDPHKRPTNIVVQDSLEKFELDNFIRFQYFSIREAHADDSFRNEPTIRLCDKKLEGDTLTLYTQRANYLAHMLTNRAIDYRINGMASMRMLFEYKSRLTPLRDSKFANHIGINALILIDNGRYVLLPQRSSRATISKRMFTASVATRLKTDDYDQLLKPDVLNSLSENVILSAMAIDKEEWNRLKEERKGSKQGKLEIKQMLIGGGRDIYEGGKPTIFYLIEIPGLTLDEYLKMKYYRQTHFDEIRRIFVMEYNQLKVINNYIYTRGVPVSHIKSSNCVVSYFYKGRRRGEIRPEKNLLALLWTYTSCVKAMDK